MKKIFGILLAVLTIGSYAGVSAMKSPLDQDIEVLRPYYQAIRHIEKTLKEAAAYADCEAGFMSILAPRPCENRTPKYLFLETAVCSEGETLCCLYTPFGQINVLPGGCGSTLKAITVFFFNLMDWKLEDVTQRVRVYNYAQEANIKYGHYPFKKEQYPGACDQSKLYLIKSVGDIELYQPKKELVVSEEYSMMSGATRVYQQYQDEELVVFANTDYRDTSMWEQLSMRSKL